MTTRCTSLSAISLAAVLVLSSCAPRPPVKRLPEQPPMVRVPGGTYLIGRDDGPENEQPVHMVRVKAFYIDKYEVTNRMYLAFVRDTGYPLPYRWLPDSTLYGKDDRLPFPQEMANLPVTWISWHDAAAYAKWRGCRLPTEVEWEIAARCSSAFAYPWGNEPMPRSGETPANVAGDADRYASGPAPVGSFPAGRSCWGVEDMAGNVWEWVADWYLPSAYRSAPQEGFATAVNDSLFGQRAIRGGSWFDPSEYARSTARTGFDPSFTSDIIGFRCARDAE